MKKEQKEYEPGCDPAYDEARALDLKRRQERFDAAMSAHIHDARCQGGAVCAFTEGKRPK